MSLEDETRRYGSYLCVDATRIEVNADEVELGCLTAEVEMEGAMDRSCAKADR